MEKNSISTYQSPTIRVIEVAYEYNFCISGSHEGTHEEDWDDLP